LSSFLSPLLQSLIVFLSSAPWSFLTLLNSSTSLPSPLKMRFSVAAAALLSAATVQAQNQWNVTVGFNDTLVFNPTNLTGVANNDIVNFQFVTKNHSVTQSTFAAPCTAAGVSSGFQDVSNPAGPTFPTWSITVENASAPLWFFCAQTTTNSTHCQAGMVFAINPTAAKNFTAFQQAAIASNLTAPAVGENPSGSVITGAGATDAVASIEAVPTSAGGASGGASGSSGSSTGASSGASPAPSNGASQLMSGSSISLFTVAGLVAGLIL